MENYRQCNNTDSRSLQQTQILQRRHHRPSSPAPSIQSSILLVCFSQPITTTRTYIRRLSQALSPPLQLVTQSLTHGIRGPSVPSLKPTHHQKSQHKYSPNTSWTKQLVPSRTQSRKKKEKNVAPNILSISQTSSSTSYTVTTISTTTQHYSSVLPIPARTPIFYGLPKTHKPGVPLRPIVSGFDSSTDNMTKYMTHYLQILASNTMSYTKDSSSFKLYLDSLLPLPDNAFLVTTDITSLYTNNRGSSKASSTTRWCPSILPFLSLNALLMTSFSILWYGSSHACTSPSSE